MHAFPPNKACLVYAPDVQATFTIQMPHSHAWRKRSLGWKPSGTDCS